jgi:N-acetylglucosaminyl-diphospho-decaprenol L-rhamnosyltransferase
MATESEPGLISVIVVSWQSRDTLGLCLGAVSRLRDELGAELVLVDNASDDGSLEASRRLAPWGRFVANTENVGFARACNQAAELARAPWLLFLNPDARIEPPDLKILLDAMAESPMAAAAGPSLVGKRGRLWPSAYNAPDAWNYWAYYSLFSPVWRRLYAALAPLADRLGFRRAPRACGWLMGACLLARRSVFTEAGGFPEAYHLYCEDAELGLKLRTMGHEVLYVPQARAVHEHGRSAARAPAETRAALFESLRLYGRRCRDGDWLGAVGRAVRLDMRARLALILLLRLLRPGFDSDRSRRETYRSILKAWGREDV